jgi:hypothetical protein
MACDDLGASDVWPSREHAGCLARLPDRGVEPVKECAMRTRFQKCGRIVEL